MADIPLTNVYDGALRAFRKQGAGSNRFLADFVDATNRTINRINRDADLATRISRIDDTEDTVALDEKYEDVLFDGITYFLMKTGQPPAKGFERQLAHVEAALEAGIDGIMTDIRNLATDADTNDETATVIGLGPLG